MIVSVFIVSSFAFFIANAVIYPIPAFQLFPITILMTALYISQVLLIELQCDTHNFIKFLNVFGNPDFMG